MKVPSWAMDVGLHEVRHDPCGAQSVQVLHWIMPGTGLERLATERPDESRLWQKDVLKLLTRARFCL